MALPPVGRHHRPAEEVQIVSGRLRPNKRLKLTGPAFKGYVRVCASEHVPQGRALAPAVARPAA